MLWELNGMYAHKLFDRAPSHAANVQKRFSIIITFLKKESIFSFISVSLECIAGGLYIVET